MPYSHPTPKRLNPRRVQLAQQIVHLALKEDWPVGYHLTEQNLVARLDVSRSPIRSALQLLRDRGVLSAERHRGFFLAKRGYDLSAIDLEVPRTHDDELYLTLIEARAAGRIPASFNQTDVMRDYEVNRTTLLRTLNRMADEGLVTKNTGQGWSFVPTLDSVQSRAASLQFRLAVEPAALEAETFSADFKVLSTQRNAHQELAERVRDGSASLSWIYETDANFHEAIATMSGNQFFLSAVVQQNRLRQLLEFREGKNFDRVLEWCKEHVGIIDAIETGNNTRAARKMRAHLIKAGTAQSNAP